MVRSSRSRRAWLRLIALASLLALLGGYALMSTSRASSTSSGRIIFDGRPKNAVGSQGVAAAVPTWNWATGRDINRQHQIVAAPEPLFGDLGDKVYRVEMRRRDCTGLDRCSSGQQHAELLNLPDTGRLFRGADPPSLTGELPGNTRWYLFYRRFENPEAIRSYAVTWQFKSDAGCCGIDFGGPNLGLDIEGDGLFLHITAGAVTLSGNTNKNTGSQLAQFNFDNNPIKTPEFQVIPRGQLAKQTDYYWLLGVKFDDRDLGQAQGWVKLFQLDTINRDWVELLDTDKDGKRHPTLRRNEFSGRVPTDFCFCSQRNDSGIYRGSGDFTSVLEHFMIIADDPAPLTQLVGVTDGAPASPAKDFAKYLPAGYILVGYDAGSKVDWKSISPAEVKPAGTDITYSYRTANNLNGWTNWQNDMTQIPSWSNWKRDISKIGNSRYIQIRITLRTGYDGTVTPELRSLVLNYLGGGTKAAALNLTAAATTNAVVDSGGTATLSHYSDQTG
jgi:hypothetical protein